MTIEVITGTPGSGKTTYAVAMRIVSEAGREVEVDQETADTFFGGQTKFRRRVVQAGIRDLACEHERLPHKLTGERVTDETIKRWNEMVSDDVPKYQRLPGQPPVDCKGEVIVQNWWLWCQPGDLIVVDEAQYMFPRGVLGRTPPYFIMMLDIHRHYGVDFLFITQHPNKLDSVIKGLVGMHRHVRSVMGSPLCMVYEWDHCSNPERYTTAVKTTFVRRRRHYKLFKSAVLHLKPPSTGRKALWIVPLLGMAAAAAAYRGTERFHGQGSAQAGSSPASASSSSARSARAARPGQAEPARPVRQETARSNASVVDPGLVSSAGSTRPPGYRDVPDLTGCVSQGPTCTCFDKVWRPVRVDLEMCRISSSGYAGLVQWAPREAPTVPVGAQVPHVAQNTNTTGPPVTRGSSGATGISGGDAAPGLAGFPGSLGSL